MSPKPSTSRPRAVPLMAVSQAESVNSSVFLNMMFGLVRIWAKLRSSASLPCPLPPRSRNDCDSSPGCHEKWLAICTKGKRNWSDRTMSGSVKVSSKRSIPGKRPPVREPSVRTMPWSSFGTAGNGRMLPRDFDTPMASACQVPIFFYQVDFSIVESSHGDVAQDIVKRPHQSFRAVGIQVLLNRTDQDPVQLLGGGQRIFISRAEHLPEFEH